MCYCTTRHGSKRLRPWLIDDQRVVVLSHCFEESAVIVFRNAIYEWGRSETIRPPQTKADENFHAIERSVSPL